MPQLLCAVTHAAPIVILKVVLFTLSLHLLCASLPTTLSAQNVSNLTIPSEEELREALKNKEITIEEFQLLLEYFYGATLPALRVVAGDIPNLDLIGVNQGSQLDELQQEQLDGISGESRTLSATKNHRVGASVRMYLEQELNDRERTRRVFQFRLGQRSGWSAEGSIGSAYGREALWRSRSLHWNAARGAALSVSLGSFDVRWGTGLAFGRRSRLLGQQSELSFESLLTPDRGGFNGLSVSGVTALGATQSFDWQAIGSTQRDDIHRLGTIGLMGSTSLRGVRVGALWGRSTISARNANAKFVQEQYSFSIQGAKSRPLWFNAEINTQSNAGALSTAVSAEWRYNSANGNIRGAFWSYPRAYRNLTGGGRSGILYESIELEELRLQYRDRRINQTGGLLRSVTALDETNSIETGLEFSGQGRGGATRGDYILALHHQFAQHELKLEAGGRTVTNSTADIESRWRLRAQFTSHTNVASSMQAKGLRTRAALTYLKEVASDPALGLFARVSKSFRNSGQLELWLNISRFRWWQGGLERLYSYIQYKAPLSASGSLAALTKLVYRYSELDSRQSRIVARFEVQAQW